MMTISQVELCASFGYFQIRLEMLRCLVMQNAQSIYQQTIVKLPNNEKLRLATLILQDLSEDNGALNQTSALELLDNLPETRVFDSAEAVDRHLKTERESWDN